MNNGVCLANQRFQRVKLLTHAVFGGDLPLVWEHGEVVFTPAFPRRVVAGGLGRFQHMANAPAYGSGFIAFAAANPALAFLVGAGEGSGNRSAEAGFFGDIQEHGFRLVFSGVEWVRECGCLVVGCQGSGGLPLVVDCLLWGKQLPHPLQTPGYRHQIQSEF